jgi:hypothetical protein
MFTRKKIEFTPEEEIKRLKKNNIRFQIEIIVIFLLFLALFFFNYNYTIFKVLIAGNYIDTKSLDSIYSETLSVNPEGHYYKDFDNAVISTFMNKLYDENEDYFTMLFNKGELASEHDEMEQDSNKTAFTKLNEKLGYLKLTTFFVSPDKLIKNQFEEISDCDTLIIDLRDNSGGVLTRSEKLAEYFLPKGAVIVNYKYRSKLLSKSVVSKNKNPLSFKHIYILQNEYTASAAEVFINALKENLDNVTIIGSKSYGKGIGQTEMKLLGGYGIKATTLNILTPNGNSINHTGISPNVTPKEDALEYALKLIEQTEETQ